MSIRKELMGNVAMIAMHVLYSRSSDTDSNRHSMERSWKQDAKSQKPDPKAT